MKTVYIDGPVLSHQKPDAENIAFVEPDGSITVADGVSQTRTHTHSLTLEQEQAVRDAKSGSTIKV